MDTQENDGGVVKCGPDAITKGGKSIDGGRSWTMLSGRRSSKQSRCQGWADSRDPPRRRCRSWVRDAARTSRGETVGTGDGGWRMM